MENLISQVQTLRAELGMKALANPKKIGKAKLEDQLAKLMSEVKEKEPEPEAKIKEALAEKKVKLPSIKSIACEKLQEVVGENEDGRPIGKAYQDILDEILAERPEAKTSLNCLRWYAGKIRVAASGYQQYTLPQLRYRSVKASQEETVEEQ